MPPHNIDTFTTLSEDGTVKHEVQPVVEQQQFPEQKRPPIEIVWRNVIWHAYLHLAALYGLYLAPSIKPLTLLWTVIVYYFSALGITAGAHRLWSHRTYKAKLPLRIFLAFCNSMASENDIIEWCRDHRMHHKYAETDGDPHNAKRGFFFAHCGWLMCKKHPEIKAKGKGIDMSDVKNDPVCSYQRKFYLPSIVVMCFVFPAFVPWYFWDENGVTAFFVCSIMRYCILLNFTWCVNSVAHLFGNKPYDRHINPVENLLVTIGAAGEGFHNYHHTFPQDYSTSEFGMKFNATTVFINFVALFGQAYDLKKVDQELIDRRKERTGDGTVGFHLFANDKQE